MIFLRFLLVVCVAASALNLPLQATAGELQQSVWEETVCKTASESPQCVFRAFWECGSSWEACEAAGVSVKKEEFEAVEGDGTITVDMRKRPWTYTLKQLTEYPGEEFSAEVGPRNVYKERFAGVERLPFKDFPVIEMALLSYELNTDCWFARSVFAAEGRDGKWRVVGFAEWHIFDRMRGAPKRDGGPAREILLHGLQVPWPELKFSSTGVCAETNLKQSE